MKKVIIYTNKTCPYCSKIKEHFEKEGIEFEEKITEDYVEEWQQIASLTGLPSVPVIFFNDNYICPGRDFGNPQHVVDRIKNEQPSEFSEMRQLIEKVKTLNFQISTAFMKTDQILRNIEEKITINVEQNKKDNVDKSTD